MSAPSIWDQILSRIEAKVGRHSFHTWFKPTSYVSDDGQSVRVRVPNGLFRDWLTKHYSAVLDEAARRRLGSSVARDDQSALMLLSATSLAYLAVSAARKVRNSSCVLARAYNSWLADRFMKVSPRLKGVALLPVPIAQTGS